MPAKQNLRRKRFGALEVLCFWGYQSGNRAWVYWCRACGKVGKRLGTHLVNGVRTNCPTCGATALARTPKQGPAPPNGRRAQKPTSEDVAAFFAADPPPVSEKALEKAQTYEERAARAMLRCVLKLSIETLMEIQDTVTSELERRVAPRT